MIDLKTYGFTKKLKPDNDLIPARITAVHKERYELVCCHGTSSGVLKSSIFYHADSNISYPTVGDFVMVWYNDSGDSVIHEVLERTTYFSRNDPSGGGHKEQLIAANFDYVFLITSLNQDLNLKKLERYLTLGWQSGAAPIIILTKCDLTQDIGSAVAAVAEIAFGVPIHAVSALTGEGMDALSFYLQPGKTIALLGSSGVGKSSLINAIAGEEIMKTGEIREKDSRGHHTTTHRQLIALPDSAVFIDTPGMRELGMWDVSEGLGDAFEDVEQYFPLCRFRNCSHTAEKDCAVKSAIENGSLSAERWQNYQKLKQEARYTNNKFSYFKESQQQAKQWTKDKRNKKKYRF